MSLQLDVRRMYIEGQGRWPAVSLDLDTFDRYCSRLFPGLSVEGSPPDAAELYLCCACCAGDHDAQHAFERDCLAVATGAIARFERGSDFLHDALQELWEKLLVGASPKVLQYTGRGPLKAWIRVAATRVALDRCRAHGVFAARHVELSERLASNGSSLENSLMRAKYGHAFEQALAEAVASLSAQQRNVLRMHVAGQCNIDEIGRAYNVHRATAARWIERSRAHIYQSVRRALSARRFKLTDSEFKSLAYVLRSELDLHLTRSGARDSAIQSRVEG
jgi:RNA polymerase sigma-70 factor, ECF subfamily